MPLTGNHLRLPRRLAGAIAALAAVAAIVAALASPAQANSNNYKLVPIRLTAFDIEDGGWFDNRDEPHLYIHDLDWAGVMHQGQTVLGADLPTVHYTGSEIRVELWERDAGWLDNNFLGGESVGSLSQPLGNERVAEFTGPGWRYVFRYKIETAP
jgi:hypothetical protein